MISKVHEQVKDYYGKQLQNSADLKTNACCTVFEYSKEIKTLLAQIHDEVLAKYYGCGLTIPEELEGLHVLDLGSGSGRDCYLASKLVGENGRVVGVDMTDEQLAVANKYIAYHTDLFKYKQPNVEFLKGEIEYLDKLGLQDDSFDLIISNCVINLCTDKKKVLADCYRKLKVGGEMYFSDVYTNKRIPSNLASDPVLYGECLGGALYWNDFLTYAKHAGFADPRAVEAKPITIENKEIQKRLEGFEFYSVTYRLFKLPALEGDCEDYGQAVSYKGSVTTQEKSFKLDSHHEFKKGKVESVCGNTYLMLKKSRFAKHFDFYGTFDTHFGIFPGCGKDNPFKAVVAQQGQSLPQGCC